MARDVLGKGLSALIGEELQLQDINSGSAGSHNERINAARVSIHMLHASKLQPREVFDQEALEELSRSIEKNGVIQPLVVRRSSDDTFEIIAGERRWRAAMMANMETVPVVIRDLDDKTALEIAVIENIQRQDLNPIEEGEGYKRLIEEFNYTHDKLALVVGKSRSHITNMLRILSLPKEIIDMVVGKKISFGHARAMVNLDDPTPVAKRILSDSLSVRQTEALVKRITRGGLSADLKNTIGAESSAAEKKSGNQAGQPASDMIDDDMTTNIAEDDCDDSVRELADMLSNTINMPVTITANEVRIKYDSPVQLDALMSLLSGASV